MSDDPTLSEIMHDKEKVSRAVQAAFDTFFEKYPPDSGVRVTEVTIIKHISETGYGGRCIDTVIIDNFTVEIA